MAVLPLHGRIAGLELRFVKLGIVHQSNGQFPRFHAAGTACMPNWARNAAISPSRPGSGSASPLSPLMIIQAGWSFPLSGNLKGYPQLFSGYGQSLIDYNYAQKSVAAGILVDF
jgi:outer membrane phospholipase A